MQNDILTEEFDDENEERIEIEFEKSSSTILFVDITVFATLVKSCYEAADKKLKQKQIAKLLSAEDLCEHYCDKKTKRRVLSEFDEIEHAHERITAIYLAQADYDVLFAPKGMFKRDQKKFDIYLLKDAVILEADLKSISSKNPDTIANRIKGGEAQAKRVVVHIVSDVDYKTLIDGLRGGVEKSSIIEILLIYKKKFYRLSKTLILSKKIFEVLKK
ncbi:MAG: hypothetical protein J0I09_03700 [Sphingobacteriia bacterium]|nr:hypothetical protein [Sphingobacteriia bacterium]